MSILILKSIHIISFVAWFAALFYLVRMLAYHAKAQKKSNPEKDILTKQFSMMEIRVYKVICNPAMMITWTCGLIMLHLYGVEWLKDNPWMHVKLLLLTLLTVYHLWLGKQVKKVQNSDNDVMINSSVLLNQIPAFFLFAIVLFAGIRDIRTAGKTFGIAVFVGILLFLAVRQIRKHKETN